MEYQFPQGIEVLVKKASVDSDFAELLLANRAEAAAEIGLELTEAESAMLAAVPDEQLDAIIKQTSVPRQHRRAFLGTAATAMLAALGVITAGCEIKSEAPKGIRPDKPEDTRPDRVEATDGVRPDIPDEPGDSRPDRVEATDGVRADIPDEPGDSRPDRVEPSHGDRPPPPDPPPSEADSPDPVERPDRTPMTKGSRPDFPPEETPETGANENQ